MRDGVSNMSSLFRIPFVVEVGTWRWTLGGYKNLIVNDENGNTVAACPGNGTLEDGQRKARLIAVAPELYRALEVLVDHAKETYPHFESERGQFDIARAEAVLKLARGE